MDGHVSIKCALFGIHKNISKAETDNFGDFVDNQSSHVLSIFNLFVVVDSKEDAAKVAVMFNPDCDVNFSNFGLNFEASVKTNCPLYALVIGVRECHLPNLKLLEELIAIDGEVTLSKIAKVRALRIL